MNQNDSSYRPLVQNFIEMPTADPEVNHAGLKKYRNDLPIMRSFHAKIVIAVSLVPCRRAGGGCGLQSIQPDRTPLTPRRSDQRPNILSMDVQ
jgi:hypothetical protein